MPRAAIVTTSHFHASGQHGVYGGAERYGVELTRWLRAIGWKVVWWQIGTGWTASFLDGVLVYSVPVRSSFVQTCADLNRAFHEQAGAVDLAIYFVTYLAYPQVFERSISISHGIYWDYPFWENRIGGGELRTEWLRRMEAALSGPRKVVSVDTVTIAWATARWPHLAGRFVYIPNFVDVTRFHPAHRGRQESRNLRVLFPRRLTSVRGIAESMHAAEVITSRFPHVEFHFVGRSHAPDHERHMLAWAARHARIFYYWRPPSNMPMVYRNMDICLIPSKSTEGTSLSCLEAMASGLAVVAGRVGGLGDLITHEYNGLLVYPSAGRLVEAIERLVVEEDLRLRLGERARASAMAFALSRWRRRWGDLVDTVMA
ncbi:MAG: glycosyltransferase family 4 protein [Bacillota bacterium]